MYQLGSGHAVSIEEILQILVGLSSKPVRVVADQSRVRPAEAPVLWGETSKAERAVGWKRQYTLERTLGDLKSLWGEQLRAGAAPRVGRTG